MYEVVMTRRFRRDTERAIKRGQDIAKLRAVIDLLRTGEPLPPKYRDHALAGDKKGLRDCHIAPDWVLLYIRRDNELVLVLLRTGTHRDVLGIE